MEAEPRQDRIVLNVSNLTTRFLTPRGTVTAVDGVSFSLAAGETLGIVGESGCGKSQTLFSIMGLLPSNARVGGSIGFEGQELIGLPPGEMNRLRGIRLALVFQDPMTALNPYLTVERQLCEVLEYHKGLSRADARAEALEALRRVHMPEPERQLRRYPHELSGGMRQRVVIAMAMIGKPALLLADEPTTALDVTIQAEILDLLAEQSDSGTAIVLVTHDLGVVARLCDRVAVMYAGRVVEQGPTRAVFHAPRHPYTQGLLAALPRLDDLASAGRKPIEGQPPDLLALPPGCAFSPRCPLADGPCREMSPELLSRDGGCAVACHHADGRGGVS
ncbi:ABC transporter ATP-binding protein [Telmatospirillum siberiense]|uniref:ABC transporter ATP-binding protein n=1 Tax=Telmatospirillum siberiense TaxID=382514 RepID=A0A2N3PPX9_9PROT|nr:ABC transporter ATP-binding protein [Telmatospirillum siberiense]PKU22465.1 ABC transporter ATP-binding protein [Telmatospirillum siberiense]